MVPLTFEQWKHCIAIDCGIPLSKAFIQERLQVYQNKQNPETKKFTLLYGEQHLNNIIPWLQQIA
ncbi:MAG: hypothetical protein FJZ80_09055 [Bacteroidetes bacterium]|nr:hypothetical protein [Bacteroidota bacterium]MBM3425015.1 hypothetical protein [Bacteroidota bacterium]